MAHDGWIRVTRDNPCVVCGKPDNCSVNADRTFAWCGRESKGSIRENGGGQFLHALTENWGPIQPAVKRGPPKKSVNYEGLANRLFAEGVMGRKVLTRNLGVSESSLEGLGVGWHQHEKYWSFPERNELGQIIGINARYEGGDKKRLPGGKAGLTYSRDWDNGTGPLFLVEGGSDTASLITFGSNVIGRPSNCGGTELLLAMLAHFPLDRQIVVVGEYDKKADGRWPGKEGAIRVATKLAEGLGRSIFWSLPPDSAKDARAWLNRIQNVPVHRIRSLFESGLLLNEVHPPLRGKYVPDNRPVVDVASWRESMMTARSHSLGRPGIYLDRSTTGAGKSFVDIVTINLLMCGRPG